MLFFSFIVQLRSDDGSLLQDAAQQRVAMPDAVLDQQANVKAEEPEGQHPVGRGQGLPVDELQSKEATLPAGQGTQGQHDLGNHHERLHLLLASFLRVGAHQTVPGRNH